METLQRGAHTEPPLLKVQIPLHAKLGTAALEMWEMCRQLHPARANPAQFAILALTASSFENANMIGGGGGISVGAAR